MTEPSQRSSRIALAAGAAAALALAIGGYVVGRSTSPPPPEPAPAPVEATPAPKLPVITPPLGRSDLLDAVAAAADAFAAGYAGAAGNAELVGRRFEVRIPFGCYGASPENGGATLRWNYDPKDGTLRVSAAPEVWTNIPWVRSLAGEKVEAVEGFWLPRPWSKAEACPTRDARMIAPPLLPAPRQTVGLAQFFEAGGSRVPRRDGKPYETVEKVTLEKLQATEGFRLVLRGRIDALPNGQPVGCHSPGPEIQPVCLIAVELDRVAIENPLSGEQLAEWSL
jgi:hypothetical protein